MKLLLSLFTATLMSTTMADNATTNDPYLWLEDVSGENALNWVREHNAVSQKQLADNGDFKTLQARLLANLNTKERIPFVNKMGPYLYNLWKDEKNPRGVWRRTTMAEYQKAEPQWETVIDVDALGQQENVNWVWHGANCLYPNYQRCLISLSRGGADADEVREFDLSKKQFIADGFRLPESKGNASWYDENTLLVSRDFGVGSLTDSGYPRVTKRWQRGSDLAKAETVFEGQTADVSVYGARDLRKGFEHEYYQRAMTFFTNELSVRHQGKIVKIDKPDDADADLHREWLLLNLKSDWTVAGKTWASGTVLIANLDDYLVGKREFQTVFTPTPRKSLAGYSFTQHHLLVNELENVRNRVYLMSVKNGRWQREAVNGLPEFGSINVNAVDDEENDDYWLTITDYLTPSQFHLGSVGKTKALLLKQLPALFDAKGLQVKQNEATSKDGTKIPYFIVANKAVKLDGKNPTLLYGYGGFEVSMTPGYGANVGSAWMEKGGVYVVANIRGGGEFGPQWHQAALKSNRHKAYEDFIAVGEDLIARNITSTPHLGIQGGSNGGLLMGNMLTLRPDLWGAIVCQVPLLDMQRYNKLLAGASWMAEYGNPDIADEWAYVQTFSPYHNLKRDAKYPPILFMTSTRDDRVHPGHARKMAAKMLGDYSKNVLYYENIEGGHGGAANNEQAAFMNAMAYSFLWQKLK